jgi:SnoaL-like domain
LIDAAADGRLRSGDFRVLRDVMGFRAKEVAAMLGTNEESVSSALKHARANLQTRLPSPGDPPPAPNSSSERSIIEHLATAYEAGDVKALVSLLTDDVVITAPLAGGKYVGPATAARVFEAIFAEQRSHRLIRTRATGNLRSACTSRTRRPECFTPTGCWLSHSQVTGCGR